MSINIQTTESISLIQDIYLDNSNMYDKHLDRATFYHVCRGPKIFFCFYGDIFLIKSIEC